MKTLSIIVSSTRPQRVGANVSSWVADTIAGQWDINILDLAQINLPFLNEDLPAGSGVYTQPHTLAWKQAIDASDAIIVVTPEYNGFFPAPLKNAIDYLYAEWRDKPMGLVGYGHGGGRRALASLAQLLSNLKANVVGTTGLFFNTDVQVTGELTVSADKTAALIALSDELAEANEEQTKAA